MFPQKRLNKVVLSLVLFLSLSTAAFAQPYWVTSIGGSGWSGTLANDGVTNSTIYICYGTGGVTLYSNATPTSIVSGSKTYWRKWQTSSNGTTWIIPGSPASGINNAVNGTSQYHRVCYSYNSSSTDILYPSPWIHIVVGPSFVSTPSSLAVSTTNNTGTSFQANWTTSSTPHGPGNLAIRHYMYCSTTSTFDPGTQAPGFNSSCWKLMTSCSDATTAIPGCTGPNTAVSYVVTGLTPGVTYYWKILAQSWHEDSSNGDLWCGYQSSYTTTQTVQDCAAPVVTGQPATQSICSGNAGTLTVSATGATAYQWQLNGTDIGGATSNTYNANAAGTYTCWVYSACDSTATSSAIITVDQSTTAVAGPDQNLCANSATLAANSPVTGTGTWSVVNGSGTFTNANDPNTTVNGLSAGTNTFRWTLLNGACSDSQDDVVINVQTASTDPSSISGTASICSGTSTTLTVTGGSLGSGANWEWYTGTCGTGAHVGSGTSISVSPTSATTYYAIAQGGCNTTTCVSLPVSVTSISADAGSNQTMCSGDSVILTVTGTGSYLWSHGGLTTASIVVKPATSTTYSVTVSNGGCTATDTVQVAVTSFADATITTSGTLCTAQAPFILGAVNAGGTWSGSGITNASSGLFSPAVAGVGTHQIIHTISGGCGDADTTNLTVATSANATITAAGPFCSNASPVNLTAANPGGVWSGQGITNAATGQFSPATAGAGSYSIVYSISGACGNSDTTSIVVNAASNPAINAAGPFCSNIAPVTLTAATAGGTWSGQGITNASSGQFSPSSVGAGTFNVVYTLSGTCGSSDTLSITVNAGANATINPTAPLCSNITSVTLTAADAGGTWTGFGITNASAGTFSPSSVGIGSYSVIYTIPGICGDSDTLGITVNAAANSTITPAGPFCSNIISVTLQAATAGGLWSGQGITNAFTGQFSPSGVGAGSYDVVYTLSGTCGTSDTLTIVVGNAADATIDAAGPFCYSDAVTTLSAAEGGGVWSGNGITNPSTGTFDPSYAGTGSHLITYMISGACGDTASIIIVVDTLFNASILSPLTYCDNISPFALVASTAGGSWSGTGITNSSSGTFAPAVAGTGNHTVIYTIPGSCGASDTVSIRVNGAPSLTVSGTTEQCIGSMDGSATAQATGGSEPYTFLWNSTENGSTINQLEPGTYTVLLTDANGCHRIDSVTLQASTVNCEDIQSVIYIPNIFSPNGDGDPRNNTLGVIGQGIKNVVFIVYDRWGEKIFESHDLNTGWDGTYKGKDVDQGVYVYTAVIELLNGTIENRKGNVTLVR